MGKERKQKTPKKKERHCPTQEGKEREESRSLVHQQKGHISSGLHWEDPGEAAALGDRDRLCVGSAHPRSCSSAGAGRHRQLQAHALAFLGNSRH